jgi:ATP-dependent DNA helicase RecG
MNFIKIINKEFKISSKEASLFKILEIKHERSIDPLLFIPYKYKPKKLIKSVSEITIDEQIIIEVKIINIEQEERFLRIIVEFDSIKNIIELIFFKYNIGFIKSIFKINEKIFISGKLSQLKKKNFFISKSAKKVFQMIHPEILKDFQNQSNQEENLNLYASPIYHSSKNINNEIIRSLIFNAFIVFEKDLKESKINFPEWLPSKLLEKFEWKNFFEAIKILHQFSPEYKKYDKHLILKANQRLMFDEFLVKNLINYFNKNNFKSEKGRSVQGDFSFRKKILENLEFKLTSDQKKVLEKEIYLDQASSLRMNRLLQGDVGSGKTLVAMLSILNSSECGFQSVLMCPTEILAKQHFEYFTKLFEKSEILFSENQSENEIESQKSKKIEIIFLSSSSKKKKKTLEKIENFKSNIDLNSPFAQIIIGTHAVFQEKVKFNQIGLIVIDEQHRFGVKARSDLLSKDENSDLLLMSATPIPRTLAMSEFGHLDLSSLKEKPAKRKKIITSVSNIFRISEIFEKIKDFIKRDEKIYWVCPLIEESLKLDLIAVEKRFELLKSEFGEEIIGIIHGRMKEAEINEIMNKFKSGEKRILLATTVIEVGVDVKDATLIVIEEASRFGLSQLHQLRGRVGRGDLQSYCILLYDQGRISRQGLSRLKSLAQTEDGFEISELDLKIRGPGEFMGLKQSGIENFLFGHPSENEKIFEKSMDFLNLVINSCGDDQERIYKKFEDLLNIFAMQKRNI